MNRTRTRLLVVAAVTALAAVTGGAPADAAKAHPLYVHTHSGQWAYQSPKHGRDILAPHGTTAAHRMRAADPGDVFRLAGASGGRYKVTAWIDITKRGNEWETPAPKARRLYDRRFHIKGTYRYVMLDRIHT